jgi:hypothetical protein
MRGTDASDTDTRAVAAIEALALAEGSVVDSHTPSARLYAEAVWRAAYFEAFHATEPGDCIRTPTLTAHRLEDRLTLTVNLEQE